jgi:hypothetical protein
LSLFIMHLRNMVWNYKLLGPSNVYGPDRVEDARRYLRGYKNY